jgi:hypothetical protein
MHGDQGWYGYTPNRYSQGAFELWYLSMKSEDRARLPMGGWIAFLDGKDPGYPERALRRDFESVREKVQGLREDRTAPDTRLADDPMKYNPAAAGTLIELMLGGIHPGHRGCVLHARLRYFDPVKRRAGLPDDVAALVEGLTAGETKVTLVNVNPREARALVLQAGAYAEHQLTAVEVNGKSFPLDGPDLSLRLAPGAGATLTLRQRRYVNQPVLDFPWDRGWTMVK